jgi:CBS domain-containing protein
MRVRDLMSMNPACCTPRATLREAAQIMEQCNCGSLPVVDGTSGKRAVGIITDRDIVCRAVAKGKDPAQAKVADCMSRPLATIHEDSTIEDCCEAMEAGLVRRMIVVDDNGDLRGIVAQADVASRLDPDRTAEVVREVSQPIPEPSLVC